MQTKTDPYNLTALERRLIEGAGWKKDPFNDLPEKFYHPNIKDTDGLYKRLDGAKVLEIIKNNMQDTLREGLDY